MVLPFEQDARNGFQTSALPRPSTHADTAGPSTSESLSLEMLRTEPITIWRPNMGRVPPWRDESHKTSQTIEKESTILRQLISKWMQPSLSVLWGIRTTQLYCSWALVIARLKLPGAETLVPQSHYCCLLPLTAPRQGTELRTSICTNSHLRTFS